MNKDSSETYDPSTDSLEAQRELLDLLHRRKYIPMGVFGMMSFLVFQGLLIHRNA
jgi:hypothetical protein